VVTIPSKRATSAETFYNRTESGDIRTQQRRVWRALAMMGASGTTAQELAKSAGYQQRDERNVCARLTEMRNLGYVREVEERVCRERGTVVIAWAIIPRAEYLGPATTFRCPECGQTVYHKVPVSGAR
jgi:transcription initiation factor IIE alpha subunit